VSTVKVEDIPKAVDVETGTKGEVEMKAESKVEFAENNTGELAK
jgi:hypothetical protein